MSSSEINAALESLTKTTNLNASTSVPLQFSAVYETPNSYTNLEIKDGDVNVKETTRNPKDGLPIPHQRRVSLKKINKKKVKYDKQKCSDILENKISKLSLTISNAHEQADKIIKQYRAESKDMHIKLTHQLDRLTYLRAVLSNTLTNLYFPGKGQW